MMTIFHVHASGPNLIYFELCLFDSAENSLRDGASEVAISRLIDQALIGKKARHSGMEDIDVVLNRPMILNGGWVMSSVC